MLQGSELIFEGEVLSLEAREHPDGRRIHTFVTFAIFEIISGVWHPDTITLRFLGGTAGGRTLRVTDLHLPRRGERGIYFVESLQRNQVHPLFGWDQGSLLARRDAAGRERLVTREGVPIVAAELSVHGALQQRSSGVSHGLLARRGAPLEAALEVRRFKSLLLEALRREKH